MVAANFSKSHPQEEDVFIDSKTFSDTPEGIPYRKLDKGELANLLQIGKKGPFTAIDVRFKYWGKFVLIEPIIQYMFEYPYGKEAIIWLRSERAFYRIISAAPDCQDVWRPVQEGANIAGHVINTLLNIPFSRKLAPIIEAASNLSGQTTEKVIELIKNNQQLVLKEIRAQRNPRISRFQFSSMLRTTSSWLSPVSQNSVDQKSNPSNGPLSGGGPISDNTSVYKDTSVYEDNSLYENNSLSEDIADVSNPIPKIPLDIVSLPIEELEVADLSQTIGADISLPARKPEQDSNGFAIRTSATSILPLRLETLKVPGLYDFEACCPFCDITFFRSKEANVVERMLWHIDAMHPVIEKEESLAEFEVDALMRISKSKKSLPKNVLNWPNKAIVKTVKKHDDLFAVPTRYRSTEEAKPVSCLSASESITMFPSSESIAMNPIFSFKPVAIFPSEPVTVDPTTHKTAINSILEIEKATVPFD